MIRSALVAAVVGLSLLGGCKETEVRYVMISEIVEHSSQLHVPVPVGYAARDLGDRLYLTETALKRGSVSLEFAVLDAAPAETDAAEIETRTLTSGDTAQSRVTKRDGGNGGPEYTLEVWRSATRDGAPAWIYLAAHTQRQRGEPDFTLSWAVFEATDLGRTSALITE
ncbi:MAG: Tsi3 family protein [Pseudomonadota bacterium]